MTAELDPHLRPLVDALRSVPPLRFETMSLSEVRQASDLLGTMFPAGPEMEAVRDTAIAGPRGPIAIRIYRPSREEPIGTVVYFHGGGFVVMGLDSHDAHCRHLAHRSGAIVVSVDYRLAPEHPFPAPGEDAIAALEAVLDGTIADIRPAPVAVAGDSAGANLALVTALWARDEGRPLALAVLGYPVTDFTVEHPSVGENGDGYLLTAEAMRWFTRQYLPDASLRSDPRASVLHADLAGVTPTLVVTAGFDPLRDEGIALVEALRSAGVEVTHHHEPSMIHGYLQMVGMVPAADATMDLTAEAIRAAFA